MASGAKWIPAAEAAALMGISEHRLRTITRRGDLLARGADEGLEVSAASVARWIEQQEEQARRQLRGGTEE